MGNKSQGDREKGVALTTIDSGHWLVNHSLPTFLLYLLGGARNERGEKQFLKLYCDEMRKKLWMANKTTDMQTPKVFQMISEQMRPNVLAALSKIGI